LFVFIVCIASKQATIIPAEFRFIPVREFDEKSCEKWIDSLDFLYGKNKSFINDYKLPSLIALSFYPELREVVIGFIYSRESTTMATRPDMNTILGSKRSYNIFINDDENFEGILLKDVPFNAQIGIIGHEIAHVLDYENQNLLGIMRIGIDYLNADKKAIYEQSIDMLTISKGLGWQLRDWAQYSMYDSDKATDAYKEFKRKTYMRPEQIDAAMKNNSMYQYSFNN
jgi:hypothetical protein